MNISIDRSTKKIVVSFPDGTNESDFNRYAVSIEDSDDEIQEAVLDYYIEEIETKVEENGPIDLTCYYSALVGLGWEEDDTIGDSDLDIDFVGKPRQPRMCGTGATNDRFQICMGFESFGGKKEFVELVHNFAA